MAPSNDMRRRSGEHPVDRPAELPPSVFYDFVEEFRGFARTVGNKLDAINTDLAEGSTRFAVYEQKDIQSTKRSDEHSGLLKTLMTDKTQRDALEAASTPNTVLRQEIIRSIVLAAVLGGCAIIYNMWRDYEVNRDKTASSKPTISAPVP